MKDCFSCYTVARLMNSLVGLYPRCLYEHYRTQFVVILMDN